MVRKLVSEGQQVIVFRETKGEARGTANYLAAALALPAAADAITQMPGGDPSQASEDLRKSLGGGVAFHNADLEREERRIIEEEFRRPGSGLRVIAATTTLAMGVNTPATSVIIAGLDHPGDKPYSVAEYKNLVGRAGRLGFAEKGTSYLLATDGRTEYDYWHRYVTGAPEDLVSRFLDQDTDPRSLIVRVLAAARRAAGEGVAGEEILSFLEASFGAFQAGRREEGWMWSRDELRVALEDLQRHELVQAQPDGTYVLTPLGRLAGQTATEVRSIVRFVDCLTSLQPGQITDPTLIAATQTAAEMDQVHLPINKKSTQKEPHVWPAELRAQGVPPRVLNALIASAGDAHQGTTRAKRAVACLLFVSGRPMTDIEGTLGQFGGAFGGLAGPIRAVASRTCDLLPTAARVAELLHPGLSLEDRTARLAVRLTYGVPPAAVSLAHEAGNALLRGDYCRLAAADLCEWEKVKSASDKDLLACLDGDARKLEVVRTASKRAAERAAKPVAATPILEPYAA